jgi:hypothetical protein
LTQQYNEKIESIIVIEISYQSTTGVKYIEQSIVDMSELKGAYQLGTPNLYSMAKSLEKSRKIYLTSSADTRRSVLKFTLQKTVKKRQKT